MNGHSNLLSAKRNTVAVPRIFREALKQQHAVNPRTLTVEERYLPKRHQDNKGK